MIQMPDSHKLTAKQTGFAQSIVDGANQSDSYRLNYDCENMTPKRIWEESSKLAANPKVSQRIASLKQAVETAVLEQRAWDSVRLIDAAEENLLQARRDKQFAAANGALRLIGQTAGLFTKRPQDLPVPITKVTIVMPSGGDPELEAQMWAYEAR